MVNTADGYEYVTGADIDDEHPHGDIDRIVIDGEIMPVRTGVTASVDADGNPIPRANILRGEDVAFLMEAVMQRKERNWYAGCRTYDWDDVTSLTMQRVTTQYEGQTFEKLTFSRKVCKDNFKGIASAIGAVCDNAMNGVLSLGTKVYSSPFPTSFAEAYNFSGLPAGFRPYTKYDNPKSGGVLSKDYLYALFQTIALCKSGYLGYVFYTHLYGTLNIDGDTGGAVCDYKVIATSGEGTHSNCYMRWGVYTEKWHTWEDAGDGSSEKVWHSGTSYVAPKEGITLVDVTTRHVAQAVAVVWLSVQFSQSNGDDFTGWSKEVWLPVQMTGMDGVFSLKTKGTFASKESLLEILDACGWSAPIVSGGETYFRESVSIKINNIFLVGTWDDHTSLSA